jgi:hypothetical protein
LSDSTTTAASRLTHATGPYVLVDGTVVANGWTGLTSGTLLHAIDLTEKGGPWTFGVWTDTSQNGSGFVFDTSCTNWTYGATASPPSGGYGTADSTGITWSNLGDDYCDTKLALYCMQQ